MPEKPNSRLTALKCYLHEWWYTLIIGYVSFAVALFLFCVMWTTAFLGFNMVGTVDFWTGVIIYELSLVGAVFVFILLGSYRKSKVVTIT